MVLRGGARACLAGLARARARGSLGRRARAPGRSAGRACPMPSGTRARSHVRPATRQWTPPPPFPPPWLTSNVCRYPIDLRAVGGREEYEHYVDWKSFRTLSEGDSLIHLLVSHISYALSHTISCAISTALSYTISCRTSLSISYIIFQYVSSTDSYYDSLRRHVSMDCTPG